MNIFEQWRNERGDATGGFRGGGVGALGGTHGGGGGGGSAREQQIFSLRKLDFSSQKLGRMICHLATSNNVLVAATTACTVFRWNLDANSVEEEIEISRKAEDSIEHVFLDPSGHHTMICLRNGDNYYLHSRSTRPKKLSRLQGCVESVAFDRQPGSETATRSFLVGTRLGCVYEMALDSGGKEKTCQLVHQLDKPISITAIHFETIGPTGATVPSTGEATAGQGVAPGSDPRFFILLATPEPTRLYHFLGGPTFLQLFKDYALQGTASFTELPGEMKRVELTCYSKLAQSRASMFALMTKEGIYHGALFFTSAQQSTAETVLMDAQLLPYVGGPSVYEVPISIASTEYHFLSLLADRLQVVSRLNGSLIQEESLRAASDGTPLGLVRDAARGITWLYTDSAVFQVSVNNEDMRVWKIYLDKAVAGDERFFDTAYEHSKKKEDQAQVLRAQAEFYLSRGLANKAALYFARAGAPFEEVVLRLLGGGSKNKSLAAKDGPELGSLRVYLQEELKILPANAKSQRTMICTWLCEIFLHQIANASFAGSGLEDKGTATSRILAADPSRLSEGELLSQFKDFVRGNRTVLDQATTLTLMTSRGQGHHRALLLFYAQIIGDYDRVIAHYVSEQRYNDAINLLTEAPFEQVESLIYKCAPILIQFEPESTTQMLISKPRLRVQSLLPALLRYESFLQQQQQQQQDVDSDSDSARAPMDRDFHGNKTNFAIVYLQDYLNNAEVNDNVPDAIVYHTLVWLLAKYDDAGEGELTAFLQQIYDKRCLGAMHIGGFNPEYVLRQCKRFDRKRAIVFCFLLLDMENAAVKAALAIDIDLAKTVAQKPTDAAKKKELWIMIAKHVVATDKNAMRALALLSDSSDVLKIEVCRPRSNCNDFFPLNPFHS